MDFGKILDGLNSGLETVKKLAPIALELGLPSSVANVASMGLAVIAVAANVKKRIEDGHVVASNEDAAAVDRIIAGIQAENDKLAAHINAS